MPILERTFVVANTTARNRAPEHWLRLFGAVCATLHFVVFIVVVSIVPIVPLPAFIDFPSAASAEKSPEFEHDVTVTVRANGDVFLQSRPVAMASLARELEASRLHRLHAPVLRLRIDRSAPFGVVRGVAVAAGVAGFERVTVMVRHIPSAEAHIIRR
ncbi:MAG TPA: biopolymer transporter ExbD [Thermoanaerobaculia bacterium]|jgi:biopolymer transport protein ExbD